MPYEPLYERFPEIAEKETRTLIVFGHPKLPDDEYALIEAYCNEPDCDCRRVFFNVASWRTKEVLAVIAYGWESKKYYAKWFGDYDPAIIRGLQGPTLNSASHQSKLAPALLTEVTHVLQDKNYVDRLKRHYRMFKALVDSEPHEPETLQLVPRGEIGRNDPCPCGSGKKYKKCCGR
jgi:hypothetical protein